MSEYDENTSESIHPLTTATPLTTKQCKAIIGRIGRRHGVDPSLITTRLMDDSDKQDMRDGLLSEAVLDLHVKLWIERGMLDFAHGKSDP